MSDAEANKAAARRFIEVMSNGEFDVWDSMLSDDATYEIMGNSVMSKKRTKAEIIEAAKGVHTIFPGGIKLIVLGTTAEEDRVAVEARGEAVSVSGEPYNNIYHFLFVFRDRQIIEGREYLCTSLVDKLLASR